MPHNFLMPANRSDNTMMNGHHGGDNMLNGLHGNEARLRRKAPPSKLANNSDDWHPTPTGAMGIDDAIRRFIALLFLERITRYYQYLCQL